MKSKDLKLVFWDWSGTLYAKDVYIDIFLDDSKKQGFISNEIDLGGLTLSKKEKLKDVFKKYSPNLVCYTWFLVEKFLELGICQVIVSNGIKRNIIKSLGDVNPFDLILTSEEFNPKPDIDMFEYSCNQLNLHNREAMIMIGDSFEDKMVADKFCIDFYKIDDYFFSALKIAEKFDLL